MLRRKVALVSQSVPDTGNTVLAPARLSGEPARDVVTLARNLNDIYQQLFVARNVLGQLADLQASMTKVEADIVAIKVFVGMPP